MILNAGLLNRVLHTLHHGLTAKRTQLLSMLLTYEQARIRRAEALGGPDDPDDDPVSTDELKSLVPSEVSINFGLHKPTFELALQKCWQPVMPLQSTSADTVLLQ